MDLYGQKLVLGVRGSGLEEVVIFGFGLNYREYLELVSLGNRRCLTFLELHFKANSTFLPFTIKPRSI